MSARSTVYRAVVYNGTAPYVSSCYGDTEMLLRSLRSELLIEKEKSLIAENRASNFEKQLRELQEKTRIELSREGNLRRDAENKIRDLELQLRTEAEARKRAETSREQLSFRSGSEDRLPLDRTSDGRNLNGSYRVENGRQSRVGTDVGCKFGYPDALQRISSVDYHAFSNGNGSSNNNDNNNNDNSDDEEWQCMVKNNEDILQKSGPTSGTKMRNRISKKHNLKKSASESTQRRNTFAHLEHQSESKGTGPVAAGQMSWKARGRPIRESIQNPEQVSSGRAGGSGGTHLAESVSKRGDSERTPGAEHLSKGGACDSGISRGAEHSSMKATASNGPTSERQEDGIKRTSASNDNNNPGQFPSKVLVNQAKKLLFKKALEAQAEVVPKERHQNSVASTVCLTDATDVTDFPQRSRLIVSNQNETHVQKDSNLDPAFITGKQRRLLWEQRASIGQTNFHVHSPGGVALESGTTILPIQRFMKLRAKWESTSSCSEA